MTFTAFVVRAALAIASAILVATAFVASDSAGGAPPAKAATLTFGGVEYVHRWSKDGQSEFTPPSDSNLARWRDMVTINVHLAVANGDQLADVANRVLGNYQSHGKIVRRTRSRERRSGRPSISSRRCSAIRTSSRPRSRDSC